MYSPYTRMVPMEDVGHIPVLQTTVRTMLRVNAHERVLDVTLGLGGHAKTFLEDSAPDGELVGIDADRDNLAIARRRLQPFGERVRLLHANFGSLETLQQGMFDVIFADLGLSSPHIDDPARGFSFRFNGPLDLRFDRSIGSSASERILLSPLQDLTDALRTFGELPGAYRLATLMKQRLPQTTEELRSCVTDTFAWRAPALMSQVFQAIRMWVNDELAALEELLKTGPRLLHPSGRMAVISYHSLEDRLVKHAFRSLSMPQKDAVTGRPLSTPSYMLITRKPVRPTEQEIASNPRSRSALLRIILRTP